MINILHYIHNFTHTHTCKLSRYFTPLLPIPILKKNKLYYPRHTHSLITFHFFQLLQEKLTFNIRIHVLRLNTSLTPLKRKAGKKANKLS